MDKKNKEKNQNIQVFVRLRPLNQRERDIRSLGVVEVCSSREVLVRQSTTPSITKKFTFDRAFGPSSKQVDVYREVVSPLIDEVLAGYNCTVFAYGQTGTGKTHTMVGESSDHIGSKQSDPMAGIIPRSLGQLFDELRLSNSEFTVRVSYLELYNEELFDLLAPGSGDTKLKMYEASKGSSEVKGLEEIRVRSKDEVYEILAQGQERRRIASTLMNAQSSRSHTVFTIVVKMNIKDNSAEGEELVKTGKLNLVDLAGSENISKAGSDNPGKGDRKRECVVINQSLLTLGRVITALVERQPHIPYRESKLTRLLQESLGGRTKTSIIATISPGHKDLEETLSTLEYAHRARNIQNKPEVNQKVLKTTVLTEYVDENDRLRRDLMASWEKNGVYLSIQSHTETQMQLANQKKEIQEQIQQIKEMKDETERLEADLKEKMDSLKRTEESLEGVRETLGLTNEELEAVKTKLLKVSSLYEETSHVVKVRAETEARLGAQAAAVRHAADRACADADSLQTTLAKRRKLEEDNMSCTRSYGETASELRARLRRHVDDATSTLACDLAAMSDAIDEHVAECVRRQDDDKRETSELLQHMQSAVSEITALVNNATSDLASKTEESQRDISAMIRCHGDAAASRLTDWSRRLTECLDEARERDRSAVDNIRSVAEQWRTLATGRLAELERAHSAWQTEWRAQAERAGAAARRAAGRRREAVRGLALAMETERLEMQAAKDHLMRELETIMTKNQMFYTNMIQLTDMEAEAIEADGREESELRTQSTKMADAWREDARDKMASLAADVAEMSAAVVGRAERAHDKMAAELDDAKKAVENEMKQSAEKCVAECEQTSQSVEQALGRSLETCCGTLRDVTTKVQDDSKSQETTLVRVQESRSARDESARAWWAERAREAGSAVEGAGRLGVAVCEGLAEWSEREERYLAEYKTYSPTGKTPQRREYSYPRVFAATSPHERIVARFRAQRASHEEEVIELLDASLDANSTQSTTAGDTSALSTAEGGGEGGGAGVFLEPARPPATPRALRSTSDTDIIQGKENLFRTSSLSKLSKLRPPSSTKKALTPSNSS